MPRKRTGTAFLRGERWVARITLHRELPTASGKLPFHETTITRDSPITPAYAMEFAQRLQERYDAGTWQPLRATAPTEQETVLQWCTRWVAKRSYSNAPKDQASVEQWLSRTALASLPLAAVTPRDCARFVEQLRALRSERTGKQLAPRTIRNVVDPIQRALSAAVFEGVLSSNPFDVLPTELRPQARDADPTARARYRLTANEVRVLLSDPGTEERWQVLWWLLLCTGARLGEAIALRWCDVLEDKPLCRLSIASQFALGATARTATKTGVAREVPVHPALLSTLEQWKREGWLREYGRAPTQSELLVPSKTKGRGALTHQSVHRALQRDLEGCGIAPHRVHDLRHTFVSLCADAGIAADVAERWTHAPTGTSARRLYLAPSWERQCSEMLKLRIVE